MILISLNSSCLIPENILIHASYLYIKIQNYELHFEEWKNFNFHINSELKIFDNFITKYFQIVLILSNSK